ncbi:MAG: carboxypeptidase regulatory-like domain-containing protein [Terracidiphilus sp.]
MAEARRNWIRWLLLGVLSLSAHAQVFAQSNPADSLPQHFVQIQSPQSGSLAGRLTDLRSAPLAGVFIVLRNQSTGAEVRATTARNGTFRIASLEAGEYTLDADAAQLGHGRLEGILVTGGIESRVQAALRFEPVAPGLLMATAPTQIAGPPPTAAPLSLNASLQPSSSQPLVSSAATVAPTTSPALLHPALSTSSPPLAALITGEPLSLCPLSAPTAADAIRTNAQPAISALVPPRNTALPAVAVVASPSAIDRPPALQNALPATRVRVTPPRAALETQSAPIEFALSVALPKAFPVKACPAPVLAATAVPPSLAQTAMLNPPPVASTLAVVQPSDPAEPAVSATVSASQLQALPASGRRWQEFLLDMPATTASADSSQASYRGSQQSAEVTVDGANIGLAFGVSAGSGRRASESANADSDPQSSTVQSGSQSLTGGRGLGVSEAAIREVTTAAGNVEAEGMRSAGGRTTIQTESGSNALHGQGFLFDRQNTWGARNPSTQWVTQTSEFAPLAPVDTTALFPVFDNFQYSSEPPEYGSPQSFTPPDHETVWGIGVGSDIRRNKLFWFAALDSYHRNDPGLAMVKHPYLEQIPSGCGTSSGCTPTITGFFATPSDAQLQLLSAQLDLSSVNPVVEGLTAYSQMLGAGLASLLGPAPRTAAQWIGFGRVDWQAAERHRFTFESIGADWNSPGGGLTGVSANYGNHSFGSSQATQQWLLARWEAYLTPNLLAVTQGSVGRAVLSAKPDTPSAFEKTFLNGNAYAQLPEIVVDSRNGFTIGNPSRFGQGNYPDERLYHGQEMLDWVHNKLLVTAGFELDHDADSTSLLPNQTGRYTYSKVANFIADALAFELFGATPSGWQNTPAGLQFAEHNCDPTGKPWYTSNGQLMGLGALPCYSHYSQMVGPTNWNLSTNDWAGFATTQCQLNKFAVVSAGLRWERKQVPPPLAALANSDLTQAGKMPDLGNNWGPRISLAIGDAKSRWPVLRLGYGMYYGSVANSTIETALTQTGSLNGDLSYFIRPTDGYTSLDGISSAPFFPYVLQGQPASAVKPSVVEFAPNFRNPEIHQAVAAIEQLLPGRVELTASAMLSLGRRLPIFIDTNLAPPPNDPQSQQPETITYTVCDEAPATPPGSNNTNGQCGNLGLGPIKAAQIAVPFYASWPSADCPSGAQLNEAGQCGWLNQDYQQISQITSEANSTYEAAMVKLTRYGDHGLSIHAHYTYAHAMDWNPNESPLNPTNLTPESNFSQEYGTSNLDVRHSAAAMVIYEAPWKPHGFAGHLANGWMISGIGQFHSGLPYTMRVTGSLPEEFDDAGNPITGLGLSLNGSGGDNRVYGLGSDNQVYNIGRNTFRYPNTWKADLRLGKKFDLGEMRQLELLAESFNLFNHQNVTEIETTGYTIEPGSPPSTLGAPGTYPTLTFLTGLKTSSTTGLPIPAFGQPLNINANDFYRERQIQLGLRMRF